MSHGAPGLVRVVHDCTQPQGSLAGGPSLHLLQEYLRDIKCCDAVYSQIAKRAQSKPLEATVVERCLILLKRYLPRYPPTLNVLKVLGGLLKQLKREKLPSGARRTIVYVQVLVNKQLDQYDLSEGDHSHVEDLTVAQGAKREKSGTLDPAASRQGEAGWEKKEDDERTGPVPHCIANSHQDLCHGPVAHSLLNVRWGPSLASHIAGGSDGSSSVEWTLQYHRSTRGNAPGAVSMEGASQYVGWTCGDVTQNLMGGEEARHWGRMAELFTEQADQVTTTTGVPYEEPLSLFHTPTYSAQERLEAGEEDVAAVVEGVLRPKSASGAGQPGAVGHSSVGVWEPDDRKDLHGQMCGCIFMKLVIDLWFSAGPIVAFPLVLDLLARAVHQETSAVRVRCYDVILNLALHSALLVDDESGRKQWAHVVTSSSGREDGPHKLSTRSSQGATPQTPTSTSSAGAASPAPPSPQQLGNNQQSNLPRWMAVLGSCQGQPVSSRFLCWLRALLFELMLMMVQAEEDSEEVWLSALGCLLHLTTQNGQFMREYVEHLPLEVLDGCLTASWQYHWSPDVHTQLIRLTVNLLYVADSPADAVSEDQDAGDKGPWRSAVLDTDRLRALGGARSLMTHFCRAETQEAKENLMVALVHAVVPAGTSEEGVVGLLQLLCGHPVCAATLQLYFKYPPASTEHSLLSALIQSCDVFDLQLLSIVVDRLESLASEQIRLAEKHNLGELVSAMMGPQNTGVDSLPGSMDIPSCWQSLRELICSVHQGPLSHSLAVLWLSRLMLIGYRGPQAPWSLPSVESLSQLQPSTLYPPDPAGDPQLCLASIVGLLAASGSTGLQVLVEAVEGVMAAVNRGEVSVQEDGKAGDDSQAPLHLSVVDHLPSLLNLWSLLVQWILTSYKTPSSQLAPTLVKLVSLLLDLITTEMEGPNTADTNRLEITEGLSEAGQEAVAEDMATWGSSLPSSSSIQGLLNNQRLVVEEGLRQVIRRPQVVELLLALLRHTPSYKLALRGVHGRPGHHSIGPEEEPSGGGPRGSFPDVFWRDEVGDAQLALLLVLMSGALAAGTPSANMGLEAAAEQLLAGGDVRQQYLVSLYLLQHWILNKPEGYWKSLKELLARAQERDDDVMLTNPCVHATTMIHMNNPW